MKRGISDVDFQISGVVCAPAEAGDRPQITVNPKSEIRKPSEVTARVLEEMPNGVFRVELENTSVVLAHSAGQKVKNFVRLLPGDRVEVVLAPHDLTRGRITRKL